MSNFLKLIKLELTSARGTPRTLNSNLTERFVYPQDFGFFIQRIFHRVASSCGEKFRPETKDAGRVFLNSKTRKDRKRLSKSRYSTTLQLRFVGTK